MVALCKDVSSKQYCVEYM